MAHYTFILCRLRQWDVCPSPFPSSELSERSYELSRYGLVLQGAHVQSQDGDWGQGSDNLDLSQRMPEDPRQRLGQQEAQNDYPQVRRQDPPALSACTHIALIECVGCFRLPRESARQLKEDCIFSEYNIFITYENINNSNM